MIPKIGMEGFLVIDNTVLGPGKGGIRMTPGVTQKKTVYRLAPTMTWKNALAGIPLGGAKSGIVWNGGDRHPQKAIRPKLRQSDKTFSYVEKYIAGPDVNTGEKEMQWFVAAVKPARRHGQAVQTLPPDGRKMRLASRTGQTGYGVAIAAAIAIKMKGLELKQTTSAIEGFGNVGEFVLKHLVGMSKNRGHYRY